MTNTANKLTVADVKKFHARADVRASRPTQVYPVSAERGPERLGTLTIWSP